MNQPLLHLRLLALLVLALLAPRLSATTTYTLSNPTVVNYPVGGPAYVIDADRAADSPEFSNPFFNRWYVTTQATITATTTTAFSIDMQARFRLVDPNGVVVPCENADVNGYVPGLFATFSALGAGTSSTSRSALLVPAVTLNPTLLYRVEAVAYSAGRGGALDSGQSGQNFRFVH